VLRIFIARVILYFDLRYKFINIKYIESMRGVTNSRKSNAPATPKSLKAGSAPKELTAREHYALILFWSGVAPHPKLALLKSLPSSYSPTIRISYLLAKFVLRVLSSFNPPVQSAQKYLMPGKVWVNDLGEKPSQNEASGFETLQSQENLTLVVPVFNAFEYIKQCLDSVFSTTKSLDILVINDASTDMRVAPYLMELERDGKIRLISNSVNLGFVKSVNLGMSNSGSNDVILLNSDTIVFDGWVEGLLTISDSKDRVATVTAMSNAATIFSLPFEEEFDCDPKVTAVIAEHLLKDHASQFFPIEIPTCHGFCVLITREVLNEIGNFDDETFGLGYGEENDFSMRAKIAGFHNLLATNVVVHHFGSKSFEKSRLPLATANMKKLLSRYPNFIVEVNNFLAQKALNRVRLNAFRALNKANEYPITAHVSHSLGGGVSKSIDLETRELDSILLVIEPIDVRSVLLKFSFRGLMSQIILESLPFQDLFSALFEYLGLKSVTIQHLLGYSKELENSLLATNAVKTLRLHDYFYLCPRIHLVGNNNVDCKLPDNGSCNNCLSNDSELDIETYRLEKSSVLLAASNVSAPSFDTSQRYRTIYKNIDIEIKHFDSSGSNIGYRNNYSHDDEIVIGILGELTKHKGLDFVRELTIAAKGLKIRFEIFGSIPDGSSFTSRKVRVHGRYRDFAELKLRVLSTKPDLFLFPGRIPETYSYTLTEALRFGIPIAYFRTGAIADRLANVAHGIPFELDAKPEEIISTVKMRLASLQKGG